MKSLNLVSNKSFWKGFDYYEANIVLSYKKDDNNCFKGKVEGSDDQIYDIDININHPRKSHCNCPFA